MPQLSLPYGNGSISLEIPETNLLGVLHPHDVPPLPDVRRSVREAVDHPIGSKRLREIVRKGERVAIIINDITRPVPNDQILPVILEDLSACQIRDRDIVVVIANGVHRANNPDEIRRMVGVEIARKVEICNHDAYDSSAITTIGTTESGIPISLNSRVAQADRRILVGIISPHHGAGYSGGRKSIFPGVSSFGTIKMLHDIEPVRPLVGELDENPLHRNALEAARTVGADFIVNTVPNKDGETYAVVAGDMERAWERGVALCDRVCRVEVPKKADIVITSPGGHPRDFDLRQAQKAISIAELLVKRGGVIILVAQCSDGIGKQDLYELLKAAGSPQAMIDRFHHIGFTSSSRKAYMFARAMLQATVFVVTDGISASTLKDMMLMHASCVADALQWSLRRLGHGATVLVIPHADLLIPNVK